MSTTLVLKSSEEYSILIEFCINDLNWSRCYLQNAQDENTYLGADVAESLCTRLLDWLTNEQPDDAAFAGPVAGHNVVWILSLSERHHVFYGAVHNSEWLLFIQNAHESGGWAATLKLSKPQRLQWIEQLKEVQQQLESKSKQ